MDNSQKVEAVIAVVSEPLHSGSCIIISWYETEKDYWMVMETRANKNAPQLN